MLKFNASMVRCLYYELGKNRYPKLGCYSHYTLIDNRLYMCDRRGGLEGYPIDVLDNKEQNKFKEAVN